MGADKHGVQEIPLIWSTDRGSSFPSVYETNTRQGIATVSPYRLSGGYRKRIDARTERFDEYGVPRCAYCGGEGDQLASGCGLVVKNGRPMIAFRCSEGVFPECRGRSPQTIACEESWQLLVPLSRLHPLYFECRNAHMSFERLFKHWRDRYVVFGDDQTARLKCWTSSVSAQRLRAEASRFLEWFRVCLRHGWIAGHKTINQVRLWSAGHGGEAGVEKLLERRRRLDLDHPYGSAAERLLAFRASGAGPPGEPLADLPF